MQVRATIEGNKVSIVQTRSEGAEGGGERGKKKHGAEETRWMVSMDRSFDVLFTQTGEGGGFLVLNFLGSWKMRCFPQPFL